MKVLGMAVKHQIKGGTRSVLASWLRIFMSSLTCDDLNPLKYWDVLNRVTNQWFHNTKDLLKATFADVMANIENHLIQASNWY